jgi:serine/threonine protein kinase
LGWIHGDIKPNNVLIKIGDECRLLDYSQNNVILQLIDYGLSERYLDQFGIHIKEESSNQLKGNVYFASDN